MATPDPARILSRLRDRAPDGALERLCVLLVEDLLGRSLGEVVDPERIASIAAQTLRDWLASERGEARVLEAWSKALEWLEAQDRQLGDVVPDELKAAAERLVGSPWRMDPEDLLRLLDREPVRALLREILHDTLVEFARKVAAPVAGTPLGLGRLGGMKGVGDRLRSRSGVLGALAEEAVSSVGKEVERQAERKAREFADQALSSTLRNIVGLLTDPGRSQEQAALRRALLQGVWDWTGPTAARQLAGGDPEAVAGVLREALQAWSSGDDFEEQLMGWLEELLHAQGHLRLSEFLADLDLLDPFRAHAGDLLLERATDFVSAAPFAAWLDALLQPDTP